MHGPALTCIGMREFWNKRVDAYDQNPQPIITEVFRNYLFTSCYRCDRDPVTIYLAVPDTYFRMYYDRRHSEVTVRCKKRYTSFRENSDRSDCGSYCSAGNS